MNFCLPAPSSFVISAAFLFVILLLDTRYVKAQYLVKNNGDTVFCDIKKISMTRIKLSKKLDGKKGWDVKETEAFQHKGVRWVRHIFYNIVPSDSPKKDREMLFLPAENRDIAYKMDNMGYQQNRVLVTSDGKTTLFEVITIRNNTVMTGGIPMNMGGRFSTLYIKNEALGLTQIPQKPAISGRKETGAIVKILKDYTGDKPEVQKQLSEKNFKGRYSDVRKYLSEYLGKPLTKYPSIW